VQAQRSAGSNISLTIYTMSIVFTN
jgi:hypothetical protein